MDPTITVAIIGLASTLISALIGLVEVRRRDKTNEILSSELERLRQIGYRITMLSPEDYGIRIVTPSDRSTVGNSTSVSGTYRNLPPGQKIWVSTFSLDGDGNLQDYWPQSEAKPSNGNWHGEIYHFGGQSGDTKEFLVMVVGPDCEALFGFFKRAGERSGHWAGISTLTSDVALCARGIVKIR